MTYKIFETLQEYNDFTLNGTHLTAGTLYLVKENKSLYFSTNNIDGEAEKYEYLDEIPEGYIKPEGNIIITENGEEIDISTYATASVDVPIPEGYIIPTGNKTITQNGENIDVAQYATASVDVAPNLTTQNITENGTYEPSGDYDGFSSVTVNVAGSGDEVLRDLIERDITSISIPDSVTSIGQSAFQNCSSLTTINIPDGVTSIGNSAFSYCNKLTTINIPDGVTSIGEYAFHYCTALTSINIPDGVTSIGSNAFYGCDSLTNITILSTTPPTVDLGYSTPTYYAFVPSDSVDTYKAADGWKSYPNIIYSLPVLKGEYLTGTIKMPSNRDFKLSNIFYKNYPRYFDKLYINDVEVSTDYSLKKNTSYTFKFELFDKRLIGGRLFADSDYNIVTSIAIPDSVTSIGSNAFSNCTNLTSIDIPNSVTSIGDYAFQSTALTEIIIPDSVTSIGYDILHFNNKITNITILSTTPPTLKSGTISGSNNCPIYVPAQSVEAYKSATNWSSLASRIQTIS